MPRRIGWRGVSFGLLVGLAAAGCGRPRAESAEVVEEAKEPDMIGAFERPEALFAGASRRLSDNVGAADVGRDFGLPDARVPYPDTYWPFVYGGTDWRWNPGGNDWRSPIEKYMAITDPYEIEEAKAWEQSNHGAIAPNLTTWSGHCPGWAAAAMSNAPILHPVFATSDGQGGIAPCQQGAAGCVRFEIGDVNALMAEIYLDGTTSLIGTTCNTPVWAIPRDEVGRVLKEGCAGVNPGSLLVAAATLLRRHQVPFAIGAQSPSSTDQIWNQPAYRYHVYDFRRLSTAEAANLVARGATSGPEAFYRWNPAARGFAFVDLGLRFVGEDSPHVALLPGTRSTYEQRVAAVIELDDDAASPRASILGGEYLDLPSRGVDRLSVSPYLWVARGPGPEILPPWADGTHHNPFIRPSLVRQLISLGQR